MDFRETVLIKLRETQELIHEIERSWDHFQYSSETLKDDIEATCNQQMTAVCQRKNQLCLQVDLLVGEQKRQLDSDLAKLNHYAGNLRSLFQLYDAGKLKNDENAFSCLQVFELPNVTAGVPQLHFAKTGEKELEKAVRGFGCVKLQPACALGDFVESKTSLFSGECSKVSESNEPWLLCDMDNCSGEDEVVAASLPKSFSATSSSIEAVSVDEDYPAGTFHKLVEDVPKGNSMVDLLQDQSSWLLPNDEHNGKNELLGLTRTFSEMKTPDIKNEVADWLHIPKDFVTCKDDLVMSKTSDVNSEWLITSKANPMLPSQSYTTKIREMFMPYFDHGNNSIWLANAP